MHWWVLIAIAAGVLLSLYGLLRWASADGGIDAEIARERLRAEQEWRGLRRAGNEEQAAGGSVGMAELKERPATGRRRWSLV
jgi:hypothetical protein